MRVAIPTEVRNNEFRVAITPVGVHELAREDREVYIQADAGVGSSVPDREFVIQGTKTVSNAANTQEAGKMVIGVREPISSEYRYLHENLALFTYLHLVADRLQTDALFRASTTAIAYETVQSPSGALPLLYPMSEIAGSLVPQIGARALMRVQGGRGVLMSCIGGVPSAKVVVLGGGVAGQSAVNIVMGLGANIMILSTDLGKLRNIFWRFHSQVYGVVSPAPTVQEHVLQAGLVVGTISVPGAKAPKLVTNDMVAEMKPESILVDIATDQGSCFKDSHPVTHDDPAFPVHSSQFYCMVNVPDAVPNAFTWALTNTILSYTVQFANKGTVQALKDSPALAKGLNTVKDNLTFTGVSEVFNLLLMLLTEALDRVG